MVLFCSFFGIRVFWQPFLAIELKTLAQAWHVAGARLVLVRWVNVDGEGECCLETTMKSHPRKSFQT